VRLLSELVVELEAVVEVEDNIISVGFDLDVWIGDRMRLMLMSFPL
jgi:hypothetical protein